MEKIFKIFEKKKIIIILLSFIITIGGCSFFIFSKYKKLQIARDTLSEKQRILETKEQMSQSIDKIEQEYAQLQSEYQMLLDKKNQQFVIQREYTKQDIISFFSTWTKMARATGVKLVSIKPITESAGAQVSSNNCEIILEAKYQNLYDFFLNLSKIGCLPKTTKFELTESEKGYPLLKVNIIVNLG